MNQDEVRQRLSPIHNNFHEGGFEECEECEILTREFSRDSSNREVALAEAGVDYSPSRRMGRPPMRMPGRIDASPEEIARKVMNTPPPKGGWEYMKRRRANRRGRK